ncbi:MAG: DHHA1 domain-containing protein, partial [Mycoplasmatales bacterium]
LKTRFDFTNLNAMTDEEISQVEKIVNDAIKSNDKVVIKSMNIDDAKELGAHAMFGEKYGEIVRVVKMGDSIELCGGTHVKTTGEIKCFHILSESGIGSGVRRIEAITGDNVVDYANELIESINNDLKELEISINSKIVTSTSELTKTIKKLLSLSESYELNSYIIIKKYEKLLNDLEVLKNDLQLQNKNKTKDLAEKFLNEVIQKDGIDYIEQKVEGIEMKDFRELSDNLINGLKSGIVVLSLVEGDKISIIIKVSKDLISTHNASDILKSIIEPFGGRGGGKPDMAQGGYTK